MSTPLVRLLTLADAAALVPLRLEGLHDSPEAFGSSYEEFSAKLPDARVQWAIDRMSAPEGGVWGAFVGDELVGMVGLAREQALKARHKAMIWGMYVSPAGRGLGLGKALMAAAIAHARTLPGVASVQLTVVPSQLAAFGLYQSLGFTEWGREPDALRVAGQALVEAHLALRLDQAAG